MVDTADSRYDREPWNVVPSEYNAPAGSWEEAALRQAIVTVTMDRASVQALVRPPLPQIGQEGVRRPALGVADVVSLPRSEEDRRAYHSGSAAGYMGATRDGWGAAL